MRLTGVWAGQGASSSCLKSGRKSQQISYRDDCWSGSFHPAPRGSRHGDFGKKRSHPPVTISSLGLLRCCLFSLPPRHAVQPSVTDAWRPCSISTPEKVSHKHELLLRTAVSGDPAGICTSVSRGAPRKTIQMLTGSGQRDGLHLWSTAHHL